MRSNFSGNAAELEREALEPELAEDPGPDVSADELPEELDASAGQFSVADPEFLALVSELQAYEAEGLPEEQIIGLESALGNLAEAYCM